MENKIKIVALFGEAGAGKDACLKEISYGQEEKIHKIIVPTAALDNTGEYTISTRSSSVVSAP